MRSPIFITSAPRAGSSVTAACLVKAGYYGGDMKPGDIDNPRGYFENEQIDGLLTWYLQQHDEYDLGKRFQPMGLDAEFPRFQNQVWSIMDHSPWFVKNVKLALCWPMVVRAFPDASWILVDRQMSSHVRSLMRTPFMTAYQTRDKWRRFIERYDRIMMKLSSEVDCLWIDGSALMSGDLTPIHDIAHFIGTDRIHAMSSAVDTTLHDHG